MKRDTGVLLSVTSLPSKYGIGCFDEEAYKFVDWLEKSGQTYWQILPLGAASHTGAFDSPYQAFSAFAGNPYFISLDALVEEGVLTREEVDAVDLGSDPNHAAIFLSNLGSIGLEGGYHHLVNWGTNSCFIVLGKKHMKVEYDRDGNGDLHEVIPIGITLDERIADGYYYSGTVALVKELLAHPSLLELPADTPVEYSIRR